MAHATVATGGGQYLSALQAYAAYSSAPSQRWDGKGDCELVWDADAHVPERGGHSVWGSCGSSSSRVAVRVAHTGIRNVVAAWVCAVEVPREWNLDLRQ